MPKINVYVSDELAAAVRDAQLPVSAVCQAALERAVRDVAALRATDTVLDAQPASGRLFARFTPRARNVVKLSEGIAREHSHNYVGTEHLLLGIITEGGNLGLRVLETLDVEIDDLRAEVEASLEPSAGSSGDHVPFTPLAKASLELATREALGFGHNYIGCEHLLLGLLATEEGLASRVLRRMGIELRTTRRAVVAALSGFVYARESAAASASGDDRLDDVMRRLDAIEKRLPN